VEYTLQSSWLKKLEDSINNKDITSPHGEKLPGFPSDDWQIHTVGLSGIEAISEAFKFMETCTNHFKLSPLWNNQEKRLLDFGTGWGRIARCFLKDFKGKNIVGFDINPTFLQMCTENFNLGTFLKSEEMPPLRYPHNNELRQFPKAGTDFIVAYSVFSHLSEEASLAWVNEFSRILSPGGMLAITTRARWFFDTAEELKNQGVTGHAKGLSEMFDSFDEARNRYDAGNVVHATNEIIGDGKHYGETFIPESYVRKILSKELDFIAFHEDENAHPVIILRKPY